MARSGVASTSFSSNYRATISGVQQWAYIHDGITSMYCWHRSHASALRAGLAGPAGLHTSVSGTAGSFTSGTHFIRYRYWNSRTGYPSAEGTQTSFLASADKKVAVYGLAKSSDNRCDQQVIEMTEASGTTYYRAAYISNVVRSGVGSAYLLSINDDTLSAQALAYADTGHERPPLGRAVAHQKGLMFVGAPVEYREGGTVSLAQNSVSVQMTGGNMRSAFQYMDYDLHLEDTRRRIATITSTGANGALTLESPFSPSVLGTYNSANFEIMPSHPNRLYISKSLYPESFSKSDRWLTMLRGRSDKLTALAAYEGGLLVFGRHSTEFLQWEIDPTDVTDARILDVSNTRGALSQECVLVHEGTPYVLDRAGVHKIVGTRSEEIGQALSGLLPAVNWTNFSRFHAHADVISNALVFFVCMGEEAYPQTAFVYDMQTGRWGTHYYEMEIRSSADVFDGYQYRPMLGPTATAPVYGGFGYSDGAHWGAQSRRGTITSASASKLTFTTASAPPATWTTAALASDRFYYGESEGYLRRRGYMNAPIYWREGDQSSTIVSVYGRVADVSPAFTSVPSVGDTIEFGRIWSVLKTMKYSVAPHKRMRAAHFHVYFAPLPFQRFLYLRIFEDGKTAAKRDWSASNDINGVTFTADDEFIKIDLKNDEGVAHVPIQLSWKHAIQFELSLRDALTPLRLFRYAFTAEVEEDPSGF